MDNIDYLIIISALNDRLIAAKRLLDKYVRAREYNHRSPNGSLEKDKSHAASIVNLSMACKRIEKLIEKFEDEATKTPQSV